MKQPKKQKEYNYILVFTSSGPKFVTESNYHDKVCKWDGKTPLEFDRDDATYIALALTVNGNYAVAVCSRYMIEKQPYNYDAGTFKWQEAKND